jgi:uncharacterized protein
MTEELIIVFVKNITLGKVKTRLAKTIGNQAALEVYTELVKVTENALQHITTNKRICFSETIEENVWLNYQKETQVGIDLGERMKNAFNKGFQDGYKRIVLIGSDLPNITANHLKDALAILKTNHTVFGPALDGGYYLIGQSKPNDFIFENKPWSQPKLLETTLSELNKNNVTYSLLETLNDIDTFQDLKASIFYKTNIKLQKRIQELHD